MGRGGEGAMGRWGDGAMGRWGDGARQGRRGEGMGGDGVEGIGEGTSLWTRVLHRIIAPGGVGGHLSMSVEKGTVL